MLQDIDRLIRGESDSDCEVTAKRQTRRLSPVKPEQTVEMDLKSRKNILKNSKKNIRYVQRILSKRNIDVPTLEKSFVQATNSQIKDLKINMEELKLQNEITINGSTIMELV